MTYVQRTLEVRPRTAVRGRMQIIDALIVRYRAKKSLSCDDPYLGTLATTMLMSGDYDSDAALCRDAPRRRFECCYLIGRIGRPSRSFPELALAWVEKKRQSFH